MASSGPRLPVYLIHWNEPLWCASATRSLLASVGVDVDLTVVDNGQTGLPRLDECLPAGVRILRLPSNTGYTGGANAGLRDWIERYPDGEFCVVGSHDLHVEPDALAQLLAFAQERPDAGIVAPAILAPHAASGGVWHGWRSTQVTLRGAPDVVERDWASGTLLFLRRKCVDMVGPFDERLGSYMEDVDYGLRAGAAGWKTVVLTRAKAWGLGTSSPRSIGTIAANTVLLQAKRTGLRGAFSSLARFTVWTVRGYLLTLVPWRSAERRAVSRRYAFERRIALTALLRSGRVGRILRHPEVPPLWP